MDWPRVNSYYIEFDDGGEDDGNRVRVVYTNREENQTNKTRYEWYFRRVVR